MPYASYRDIPRLIEGRRPFEGNSVSANVNSAGSYQVKSYATEIYSDEAGLNRQYYSRTTSKIQRIIRAAMLANPGRFTLSSYGGKPLNVA